MQIKDSLYLKRYLIGTLINILVTGAIVGSPSLIYFLIFFVCVLMNQLFLIIFGIDLVGLEKVKFIIPTPLLGVLKLLVLILGFYIGIEFMGDKIAFLVISYIFQLINLVLSTKRIVKKN